jgi:hypothetical protein
MGRELNDTQWESPMLPIARMYKMAAVNRLDVRRQSPVPRTPGDQRCPPVRFI